MNNFDLEQFRAELNESLIQKGFGPLLECVDVQMLPAEKDDYVDMIIRFHLKQKEAEGMN